MAVQSLSSIISAFRSETAYASINPERLGSILQKIVDAIITTSGDRIIITCEAIDDELHVKGASTLVEAGFVPVIFRYSLKSNHLTDYKEKRKFHGPKRRGWNMMQNYLTALNCVQKKNCSS